MTSISRAGRFMPTRPERLLTILLDGGWHPTAELVRRVGHTFFVAKWILVHRDGHQIEKRKHATRVFQFEYRLVPPDEQSNGRRGRPPRNLPVVAA